MSEWLDIQEFGRQDVKLIDGTEQGEQVTATDGEGTISPRIIASIDYFLRDENGVAITDATGLPISLEGTHYA